MAFARYLMCVNYCDYWYFHCGNVKVQVYLNTHTGKKKYFWNFWTLLTKKDIAAHLKFVEEDIDTAQQYWAKCFVD